MSRVGFIGLGQMGSPMASNLIKGGHQVKVFDLNKDAMSSLVKIGGIAASSIIDAASHVDFIITMLPNGDLVRGVIFGDNGISSVMAPTTLLIDMSTIHPFQTDKLIMEMTEKSLQMMEAPVGRTSDHAVRGELLILAGGTKDQIEISRPLFECMGSEIVDCGGPGKAIRMKVVNNYMSVALNALSAEAATLTEALDLDMEDTLRVMSATPAGKGHFNTTWPGKVLAGDLSPTFMVDHAHKDLSIALDIANQVNVPVPCGAASRELYNMTRAAGRGRQDWTAVLEQLRISAGMKPRIN